MQTVFYVTRIHRGCDGSVVGSVDLPSEPEDSDRAEQAGGGTERLGPRSREPADPDERGRLYEAARAHAEAETADRTPEAPGRMADRLPAAETADAISQASTPSRILPTDLMSGYVIHRLRMESVWSCGNSSKKCRQRSASQTARQKFPTSRKKASRCRTR